MARQVASTAVAVAGELDELGTPENVLQNAVRQGLVSASRYRAAKYPVVMPGFVAWGETLGALRTGLMDLGQGWEPQTDGTYETVVHNDRDIALAVATGNEYTGVEGPDPMTKSAKGLFTERAAAMNQTALDLWSGSHRFPIRGMASGRLGSCSSHTLGMSMKSVWSCRCLSR